MRSSCVASLGNYSDRIRVRGRSWPERWFYAASPAEIEQRRGAFLRKWRLKCKAVADSLEEAGDRLFTFTRLPPSQWKSARTTNAIERLHEEFKRRIKTQTVLPSAETAAMLFWALLASGQITMRKVDGWQSLTQKLADQSIDLAAGPRILIQPETANQIPTQIATAPLQLCENGKFRAVAVRGVAASLAELLREPVALMPGTPASRLADGERFVQVEDVAEFAKRHPEHRRANASMAHGLHTVLFVPLRKETDLLGHITGYREEVRPFSEKEITLLENFAAQAVIAMENARLLTETREALEQQTATAEVLQVINNSPGDLAPVFDAMLEKATRLSEAPFGVLRSWDGECFHVCAVHGEPRFSDWVRQRGPTRPEGDDPLARITKGAGVVHFGNPSDDPGYVTSPGFRKAVEVSGMRSGVTVPLRKDDALLGAITIYRQEVRPFSDKQIALLENFAAQAVIAMESARLITETRDALEQQTRDCGGLAGHQQLPR